jgi:hypothetical protein
MSVSSGPLPAGPPFFRNRLMHPPTRSSFLVALALLPLGARAAVPAVKPSPARKATAKAAWKPAPAKAAAPAVVVPPVALTPETPPTTAIDQLVARGWRQAKVTPAPPTDDRAFARRLYLDLAGRIPTPAEVDAFAADASTGKRAALADRLLASPEYAEHMRDVFDVVFMGRGGSAPRRRRGGNAAAQGLREQWLAYLERGFAENRPWDRTARDIVLARPEAPADLGSIWFLYARNDKYQEMAEVSSAALLGVQVQCAQCHNHFLVPEIKQKDYWGLVAFFSRTKNQDTKDGPRVAESAIGGFSNYASLAGQSFPAELTFFGATVPEARPAPNMTEKDAPELYRPVNAAVSQPPVPLFSRREQLADKVLKGNPLVARAAVNRFWELLMGRGIVHPVDKMDSTHPPSHPELLDWLAKDFERSGYDVKRLVRAIVLSKPYGLQARAAKGSRPELFAAGIEKPLTAEQLYRSLMVATTGKTDAEKPELAKALVEIFPDLFAEENVATLRQAMFLTNNPMVEQLTAPTPGTTAERLAGIPDPTTRVREAFRVAYARDPDAAELKAATAYLKARAARAPQATAQLWWAILAGAEFRFNH